MRHFALFAVLLVAATSIPRRAGGQSLPQCTYRGVNYAIGDRIPQIAKDSPCKASASCIPDDNGGARIVHAEMNCFAPPDKAGCIPLFSPDKCCAVKFKCPGDESTAEDKNNVCNQNGTTYVGGQRVPSGDPCKSCICLTGTDGKTGPVCRDIHCLTQPPHPNCVPVYAPGGCCPISYTCR